MYLKSNSLPLAILSMNSYGRGVMRVPSSAVRYLCDKESTAETFSPETFNTHAAQFCADFEDDLKNRFGLQSPHFHTPHGQIDGSEFEELTPAFFERGKEEYTALCVTWEMPRPE